jgi:hypothetical protein
MAIRLMSAMLVTGARMREGNLVLLNPLHGIDVPAKQRQGFKDSGKTHGYIGLPNYEIVLVLWGGVPGEQYRITGGFGIPGKKMGRVVGTDLAWPDEPSATVHLKLDGKIDFTESMLYEFRMLAGDEALGTLPIIIRWDDETDF